jgi:hypothetical protein
VPNNNYCLFEDFFSPILEAMHDEQDSKVRAVTAARLQL